MLNKFFLSILILLLFNCQKEKEETLQEKLTKISFLSLASTAGRCDINSTNNPSYFTSNTTPSGGATNVARISTTSNNQYYDIYYPTTGTSLPIIVLYQGGNVHSSFYSKYAARVASAGYAVYVGNRCTTFITQFFIYPPASLGNKSLALAKSQNSDSSSPLFGKLETTKVGFLGHSLGGVVGIFSMNNICEFPFCDSEYNFVNEVKGGIFYGTGLNSNFSNSRFAKNPSTGKGYPLGYIQGSNDGANKPTTGRASYDNSIPIKVYYELDGANHYGITDVNNPFGANTESQTSTLSQDDSISKIALASIKFLDTFVKENTTITNGNSGITGVTVEISQ
jgi:hypothetical protein